MPLRGDRGKFNPAPRDGMVLGGARGLGDRAGHEPLRVAVRADASSAIGTGHVLRAMAVFEPLRRSGGTVVFVCREAPGHLIDLVGERGFAARAIPDDPDPLRDAAATRAALAPDVAGGGPFDWLWVDHYGLDRRFEEAVGDAARAVAVMDDLADRPHAARLLVDPAHPADRASVHDGLVPEGALRLVGPDYVPLRAEFTEAGPPVRTPGEPVRRVLVTLGGNDPLDTTGLVLDALDTPELAHLALDVTAGTSNPRLEALRARAARMPNVALHVQHPRPSGLMAAAQLCVGAGGTTSWERCYMGLPTLGLVLADNQVAFMAELERLGVVRSLGWANRLGASVLRDEIVRAIGDGAWRAGCTERGRTVVDGRGVQRILDALWTNRTRP